jgi:hypothetical protein
MNVQNQRKKKEKPNWSRTEKEALQHLNSHTNRNQKREDHIKGTKKEDNICVKNKEHGVSLNGVSAYMCICIYKYINQSINKKEKTWKIGSEVEVEVKEQ